MPLLLFHSILFTFISPSLLLSFHPYFLFPFTLLSMPIPLSLSIPILLLLSISCYTSILHSYHWLLSTGIISTICLQSPLIMSYSPFLIISPLISYQSLILSLFHLSIYLFPLVYKTCPCCSYNPVCNRLKHQSILLT